MDNLGATVPSFEKNCTFVRITDYSYLYAISVKTTITCTIKLFMQFTTDIDFLLASDFLQSTLSTLKNQVC